MAKNQYIRIRPIVLKADHDAYTALQAMSDYAPANPEYAKAKATEVLDAMLAAQDAEVNAVNALICDGNGTRCGMGACHRRRGGGGGGGFGL